MRRFRNLDIVINFIIGIPFVIVTLLQYWDINVGFMKDFTGDSFSHGHDDAVFALLMLVSACLFFTLTQYDYTPDKKHFRFYTVIQALLFIFSLSMTIAFEPAPAIIITCVLSFILFIWNILAKRRWDKRQQGIYG